ncbi:MAG: serine hydrolase [Cyclobacteriaceae bacterium]|nr:serine hydrolase [Cyclobacteriaceae bacterium]
MKKVKQLFLIIIFFSAIKVSAQEFNRAKMDSLFARIDEHQKGMGSIAIYKGDSEVYQKSIGFASIADKNKASVETKYRIGSISKTFTATIIMQLINDGKLELSTKLSSYYPEIKNSSEISIEHLLRHRSGIFNFTNAQNYTSWMEKPISKQALTSKIATYESVFKPNTKAEYSNSNYVLLSFIAEKIKSKEFSEIIQKQICKPCALKNTYYGSKISVANNEALSYTKLTNWDLSTETDMSVPVGAGAIVSTPSDLNLFLNCLFNNKLVNEETLAKMMEIQDGYGIGLLRVPFYTKYTYGHTGGIDGFRSNAFYFPEDKVSISYLSNGVVMPLNDILIGALSIYYGLDFELPEFKTGLELTSEELDKYLGVYSSPTFPLKITITKKGNALFAQATGQSSFPLEAYEIDKFKFDQAMLKMEFNPKENQVTLLQGEGKFLLTT